jgi:hypothetical protein
MNLKCRYQSCSSNFPFQWTATSVASCRDGNVFDGSHSLILLRLNDSNPRRWKFCCSSRPEDTVSSKHRCRILIQRDQIRVSDSKSSSCRRISHLSGWHICTFLSGSRVAFPSFLSLRGRLVVLLSLTMDIALSRRQPSQNPANTTSSTIYYPSFVPYTSFESGYISVCSSSRSTRRITYWLAYLSSTHRQSLGRRFFRRSL